MVEELVVAAAVVNVGHFFFHYSSLSLWMCIYICEFLRVKSVCVCVFLRSETRRRSIQTCRPR